MEGWGSETFLHTMCLGSAWYTSGSLLRKQERRKFQRWCYSLLLYHSYAFAHVSPMFPSMLFNILLLLYLLQMSEYLRLSDFFRGKEAVKYWKALTLIERLVWDVLKFKSDHWCLKYVKQKSTSNKEHMRIVV